jgi:hypothetical protein
MPGKEWQMIFKYKLFDKIKPTLIIWIDEVGKFQLKFHHNFFMKCKLKTL